MLQGPHAFADYSHLLLASLRTDLPYNTGMQVPRQEQVSHSLDTVPSKVPPVFWNERMSTRHGCPTSQVITRDLEGPPIVSPVLGSMSPLSN